MRLNLLRGLSFLCNLLVLFGGLAFAENSCPADAPTECCQQPAITVSPAGQYPKYIQGPEGNWLGGTTSGCGYGCIVGAPGTCVFLHSWQCSDIPGSGIISGSLVYYANSQSSSCEYSKYSTPVTYSILLDRGKPDTSILFPEYAGYVNPSDSISGTATDDYQLSLIDVEGAYGISEYNFLGNLPAIDDGGTLYYNDGNLRNASWSLPLYEVVSCTTTDSQNIDFYLGDSAGNVGEFHKTVRADCEAPKISITSPISVNKGTVLKWGDWDHPEILGTSVDNVKVDSIWLTIQDVAANRWWNGAKWSASISKVYPTVWNRTTGEWYYGGLFPESMRSGAFSITAYAKDLVGHVTKTNLSTAYTKRIDLGKQDFSQFNIHVKDVRDMSRTDSDANPNVYSFTTKDGDNSIGVEAQIQPLRIALILNNSVQWKIFGINSDSGKPNDPHSGNVSNFVVSPPLVPVAEDGRTAAMGYSIFPRVDYDYHGETFTLGYSSNHGYIQQDKLDQLRQEYIDFKAGKGVPDRDMFDQEDAGEYPGLLGNASGDYGWHIVKELKNNVGQLAELLSDYGVILDNTHIASGYRTPRLNNTSGENGATAVHGSRISNHMYGKAFDYGGFNSPDEYWRVYYTLRENFSTHENFIYNQKGCIITGLSTLSDLPEFPVTTDVVCYDSKTKLYDLKSTQPVISISKAHVSFN